MAARIQIKTHEGVAGLKQRQNTAWFICCLNWAERWRSCSQQLLGPLDGQFLCDINKLATAIVSFGRDSLRRICWSSPSPGPRAQHEKQCSPMRSAYLMTLATQFTLDRTEYVRIGFGQWPIEEGVCEAGGRSRIGHVPGSLSGSGLAERLLDFGGVPGNSSNPYCMISNRMRLFTPVAWQGQYP